MGKIYKYSHIQPITINEDVDFFSKIFFEKVEKRLIKSYIFKSEKKHRQLEFEGSMFRFVWNAWDLFNAISKGKIKFGTVDEMPYIKFQINLFESLVIALIFSIIPLFAFAFEPQISIMLFGAIWILYLINYLVASVRFRTFIARTLEEVKKQSSYIEEEEEEIIIN